MRQLTLVTYSGVKSDRNERDFIVASISVLLLWLGVIVAQNGNSIQVNIAIIESILIVGLNIIALAEIRGIGKRNARAEADYTNRISRLIMSMRSLDMEVSKIDDRLYFVVPDDLEGIEVDGEYVDFKKQSIIDDKKWFEVGQAIVRETAKRTGQYNTSIQRLLDLPLEDRLASTDTSQRAGEDNTDAEEAD